MDCETESDDILSQIALGLENEYLALTQLDNSSDNLMLSQVMDTIDHEALLSDTSFDIGFEIEDIPRPSQNTDTQCGA